MPTTISVAAAVLGIAAGISGGGSVVQNFSYSQVSGGIYGTRDTTTTAGRTFIAVSGSGWSGFVTGTDATFVAHRVAGDVTGMIEASIDGGVFTALTYSGSGGIFPLFAGLSDTVHNVVVKPGTAYGNTIYIPSGVNVIAVTGSAPSVETATGVRAQPLDGNALISSSGFPTASIGGNFLPLTWAASQNITSRTATTSPGSCVPTLRFRCDATKFYITTGSRWIFVSIDGARPTRYDTTVGAGSAKARLFKLSGLSGTLHTYNVWPSWDQGTGQPSFFSVGTDAVSFTDVGTKKILDIHGDSIARGAGSTSPGDVDTLYVASNLGCAGISFGIDGSFINEVAQRMGWNAAGTIQTGNGYLDNMTIAANAVAIVEIGRNDCTPGSNVAMTAQQITDYTNIVTTLKAKYGRVICRGVIPTTGQNWSNFNVGIAAIVTGKADANINYVNTDGWTTITYTDGTHPNDGGYIIMVESYEIAAYAALI